MTNPLPPKPNYERKPATGTESEMHNPDELNTKPVNPMAAPGSHNRVTLPTWPSAPITVVPTGSAPVPAPNAGGEALPVGNAPAPHID